MKLQFQILEKKNTKTTRIEHIKIPKQYLEFNVETELTNNYYRNKMDQQTETYEFTMLKMQNKTIEKSQILNMEIPL